MNISTVFLLASVALAQGPQIATQVLFPAKSHTLPGHNNRMRQGINGAQITIKHRPKLSASAPTSSAPNLDLKQMLLEDHNDKQINDFLLSAIASYERVHGHGGTPIFTI